MYGGSVGGEDPARNSLVVHHVLAHADWAQMIRQEMQQMEFPLGRGAHRCPAVCLSRQRDRFGNMEIEERPGLDRRNGVDSKPIRIVTLPHPRWPAAH